MAPSKSKKVIEPVTNDMIVKAIVARFPFTDDQLFEDLKLWRFSKPVSPWKQLCADIFNVQDKKMLPSLAKSTCIHYRNNCEEIKKQVMAQTIRIEIGTVPPPVTTKVPTVKKPRRRAKKAPAAPPAPEQASISELPDVAYQPFNYAAASLSTGPVQTSQSSFPKFLDKNIGNVAPREVHQPSNQHQTDSPHVFLPFSGKRVAMPIHPTDPQSSYNPNSCDCNSSTPYIPNRQKSYDYDPLEILTLKNQLLYNARPQQSYYDNPQTSRDPNLQENTYPHGNHSPSAQRPYDNLQASSNANFQALHNPHRQVGYNTYPQATYNPYLQAPYNPYPPPSSYRYHQFLNYHHQQPINSASYNINQNVYLWGL